MLYLLPGTGADARMYGEEWRALEDTVFPDWPEYRGETTLEAIARRVIEENDIQPSDSVGGSSLGGMVACEIAMIQHNPELILISSATDPKAVNVLLRCLRPTAHLIPAFLVRAFTALRNSLLFQMFRASEIDFVRATCYAIPGWQGYTGGAQRLLRVHGQRDPVIFHADDARLIPKGGHLITMNRAAECVDIIREWREA